MELMKVIRPIYIRSGPGRSHSALAPVFPSGRNLVFDGVEIGETWKGINEWYYKINDKDEKQYYWKGGLQPTGAGLSWAIRALGIDQVWIKTMGENVKIAIIDTGIDIDNDDLKTAIICGHNVITDQSYPDVSESIRDHHGHGTACATIIASQGRGLKGIAPASKLIIIKIAESDTDTQIEQLMPKAINKAVELGAHIISMSCFFSNPNAEVTRCIMNHWNDHVFVAAAGNTRGQVYYPANIPGMISVGAITVDNTSLGYKEGNYVLGIASGTGLKDAGHEGITLVAPGEKIPVYTINGGNTLERGTSFAAPYVAGVVALLIALKYIGNGRSFSQSEIYTELITHTFQKPAAADKARFGNGIIDPVPLLS